MNKPDKTVLRETAYITVTSVVFSLLLQAVFLIAGFWDYKVLLGNLLGDVTTVLNFFLMGLTVQKAVLKDEKSAAATMKASQTARNMMLLLVAVIGVTVPCFNILALLPTYIFPRLAVLLRPLAERKNGK